MTAKKKQPFFRGNATEEENLVIWRNDAFFVPLKSLKYVFFLLVFIVGICTNIANSCSCIRGASVEDEMKYYSDVVLAGTIISKEETTLRSDKYSTFMHDDGTEDTLFHDWVVNRYELVVDSCFKGEVKADTITVYSGLGNGDCGYNFAEGKNYIVYGTYASYVGKDWLYPTEEVKIWTHSCKRTKPYDLDEIQRIRDYMKTSKN